MNYECSVVVQRLVRMEIVAKVTLYGAESIAYSTVASRFPVNPVRIAGLPAIAALTLKVAVICSPKARRRRKIGGGVNI